MDLADVSPHRRAKAELDLLNQCFPGLKKSFTTNGTPFYPGYIDITMTTTAGNRYEVRLIIPAAYPDTMPTMLVVNPKPLVDYYRHPLLGTSASMHVLSAIDGFTRLCHYTSELWDASLSLHMVVMKGGIWLEAYEGHRRNGKPIDFWLSHKDPSCGATVTPIAQARLAPSTQRRPTPSAKPPFASATPVSTQSLLQKLATLLRRLLHRVG